MVHETATLRYWRALNQACQEPVSLDRAASMMLLDYTIDEAALIIDDVDDCLNTAAQRTIYRTLETLRLHGDA